jgi:ketosteroid isomerase-like protein
VLATNVYERRRGEWKMIHHHTSPFSSDEADIPEGPLH